jgi:ferredoxin
MIVADKKPIEEIIEQVKDVRSLLVLGCNECVTVCEAGGKKEVGVLASALRMVFLQQGREVNVGERTLERQCDSEYLEELRDVIDQYDAVVSLACGVGIQFTAEKYPSKPVYPGVNTSFMGATQSGSSAARGAAAAFWPEPGRCVRSPAAPNGSSTARAEAPPMASARSARTWTAPGS